MRFASLLLCVLLVGCGGYAGRGASRGAGYGALAGAVGGLVRGLVWNDPDALAYAVDSAIVGAAAGAATGGASGSETDRQIERAIGKQSYAAVSALADCRHDLAIERAQDALGDPVREYRLAGAWVIGLVYADVRDWDALEPYYPTLVDLDDDIESVDEARQEMRRLLPELKSMRVELGSPPSCPDRG